MRVIVVGAGAAGLAAAIFAARAAPGLDIRCLDGARGLGAKILVSGGSRCNVTNRVITERDFWGGSPRVVRAVLRAFPAERAAAFFESLGVRLHEEEDGKLFPDTNRARTVLEALLGEARRLGIGLETGQRVLGIERTGGGFRLQTADGTTCAADLVVLATGGRSLPKSGSDGFGYELARRLGHGLVPTTPALAPLVLAGECHRRLAGVAHEVSLALRVEGRLRRRLRGPLLWTHVGMSGPVVLNLSRHWHRARLETADVSVTVSVCPDETFASLERWWLDQAQARPRARVATVLGTRLPAAVAEVWATSGGLAPEQTMASLTRDARRDLLRRLTETPLDVTDSRGYQYAEVTAGGVPLEEIDSTTMQSRVCPGLFLVGEILDVDGRLGGFNFQWAWSSGWVAGWAIAREATG